MTAAELARLQHQHSLRTVPDHATSYNVFVKPRSQWTPKKIARQRGVAGGIDLDAIPDEHDDALGSDDNKEVWRLKEAFRTSFGNPQLQYVKYLGHGGLGLALHFRYVPAVIGAPTRQLVVKTCLEQDEKAFSELRKEEAQTRVSPARVCRMGSRSTDITEETETGCARGPARRARGRGKAA